MKSVLVTFMVFALTNLFASCSHHGKKDCSGKNCHAEGKQWHRGQMMKDPAMHMKMSEAHRKTAECLKKSEANKKDCMAIMKKAKEEIKRMVKKKKASVKNP